MNETVSRLIRRQKEKEQSELDSWIADRAKLQNDLSIVQSKIDVLELSVAELAQVFGARDPETGRFLPSP